jgi:hypothetical protein
VPRVTPRLTLASVILALAAGCGGSSPAQPAPPPVDVTPPKPNDAPIITSLTTASPRVEANDEVAVAASVEDAETPIDQLSYQWSAAPVNGEFIGTGRNVRWRAPKLQRTPDLYSLNLLVTETYTSAGRVADNKVLKSVAIHYNDSPTEITRIGARFLTELFPDFSVSPQAAVQDFTDSCDEKAKEFSDVTNNRINFHILSGTYSDITVDIDPSKTSADVSGRCTFVDIPADPNNPFYGKRESVSGICTLTAVYENWRWFLCSSHFKGLGTVLLGKEQYRVPGRMLPPTE